MRVAVIGLFHREFFFIPLWQNYYGKLFGLENLDQVRLSVFENSVSKNDIGVEPSIETIQSNTAAIAKKLGKKSVSIISSALKKYLPAADYVTRACPQLSQMAIEAR